jgi:hypothetical protein
MLIETLNCLTHLFLIFFFYKFSSLLCYCLFRGVVVGVLLRYYLDLITLIFAEYKIERHVVVLDLEE